MTEEDDPVKSLTRYLTLNLPARMAFENITAEVERVVSTLEVPEDATLEALLRQAFRAMPR